MIKLIKLIFIFLNINNALCDNGKTCSFTTCGSCISSIENCVWCTQEKMDIRNRCLPMSASKDTKWCKRGNIINPKPVSETKETKTFNDIIKGQKVQVTPQKIIMKVRPGVPQPFEIQYKPAKDFPLDVYFLMDISFTMRARVKEVSDQAEKIQKELKVYTNNVRLGLGTFVEKPGFPYVDLQRHSAHAFLNHISLTDDMEYFKNNIPKKELFGANYDDPEAGLDALMQSMLCDRVVGWRSDARRIIVLCTDSTYHSAGDGKMIGIIKPNDMQCHYENNTFKTEMKLDYPSVSQIKKVAHENNFMIIFAATEDVRNEYTALAKELVNADYAKQDKSGGTVLQVIKAAYEKMRKQAKMRYDHPAFVHLTSNQDCEKNINCEIGHSASLTVNWNLTVTSCPPPNLKPPYKVTINPAGLSESLNIEFDVICKCEDCENDKTDFSHIVSECNNAGVLQCGICKCKPGSSGYNCQCNGTSTDDAIDWKLCKHHPDDTQPCNGHGICKCGKCEECFDHFSGEFCEFNDEACPKAGGYLCAGHGACIRQKCVCELGWSGDNCNCPLSQSSCIAPYSSELCSGHGDCNCGKCTCHQQNNESYWGDFCDYCDECADKRCKELEKYVLCLHKDNKTHCDEQFNKENNTKDSTNKNLVDTKVTMVNATEINAPKYYTAKRCTAMIDSINYIVFKYFYDSMNNLNLVIQTEPEKKAIPDILIPILSAVGVVLLIGIATIIIWKILVDLHDKREYEKFASESAADGYDVCENITYIPPATTFENPAFTGNQKD